MGKLWRLYDPLNLPKSFRIDGIGVKFKAKIEVYRLRGLTNFLVYRYFPIEIIEIHSLERIKGFVIDEVTHKPVVGAKIILESRAPPLDWKVLDECISDGKGRYELKSVDLDLKMSYRVRAFKEGYRNFEYSLSPVPSGKTRFLNISLIGIKERFSIDYPKDGDTVSGKVVIKGRIYDSEIKAIWISIDKCEWRRAEIYWLGFPNPDHVIAIWQYEWDTREAIDGKHVISVRAWYGGSYIYKHVNVIVKNGLSIVYGQVTEAPIIQTDSNESSLKSSGKPIEGAKVAAYPIYYTLSTNSASSYPAPYVTYTDENGTYTIENITPGHYILKVSKSGYEKKEERIFFYSGDNIEKTFILDRIKENIIYVDESYNGKDICLNMNQYLNLTLIQNPSTGYRWDFVDFNESIMEIVDHFCWGYPQHDPPILGASCNETWIFKPLRSCDFELKLKYWQPWEPNSTLKTFNLTMHIIDIHLDLTFPQGVRYPQNASIPIMINLENRGNVTALVSCPRLMFSSLYIYITTPSGREVKYIGPYVLTWPGTITIPPGAGYLKNLTISSDDFGFNDGTPYYFDEIGKHDVKVVYRSWGVGDNRWIGSIESDGYSFYIEPDIPS